MFLSILIIKVCFCNNGIKFRQIYWDTQIYFPTRHFSLLLTQISILCYVKSWTKIYHLYSDPSYYLLSIWDSNPSIILRNFLNNLISLYTLTFLSKTRIKMSPYISFDTLCTPISPFSQFRSLYLVLVGPWNL